MKKIRQMMAHTKRLRGLINLIAGEPTVIVTSHPSRASAARISSLAEAAPFLNEMDELYVYEGRRHVVTEISGKQVPRNSFSVIPFRLEVGKTHTLKDRQRTEFWTVMARPLRQRNETPKRTGQKNKAQLLAAMMKMPGGSLARQLRIKWFTKDGSRKSH